MILSLLASTSQMPRHFCFQRISAPQHLTSLPACAVCLIERQLDYTVCQHGHFPDISFSIPMLSQFLNNPGHTHWEAIKYIFQYLLNTKDLQLTFGGGKHGLEGYTDADSASQGHRCTAVSWSSCKQELITLSTAEAEHVTTTYAIKEAIWL